VNAHVFPNPQGHPQVKNLKIKNSQVSILGGYRAVEQHFGGGHFCGRGAYFAWIFDQVYTSGETHTFNFCFVRALRRHTSCICSSASGGKLITLDVPHCLRAFRHAVQDSVCEPTKLIGCAI
jgi:hypothetical protein